MVAQRVQRAAGLSRAGSDGREVTIDDRPEIRVARQRAEREAVVTVEARRRGAPIIAIDPLRTRTAAQCDEWIPIRPGTDAALALGMMHVLFQQGLEDRDYLARFTLGEEALRTRAREYAPERVAGITGIPAAKIVELGERYGRSRAAFIRVNYGLQRHAGGGMAVRTIACLPAVTGHWRRAGGGVQLSTSANFQFNKHALERPDLSSNRGDLKQTWRISFDTLIDFDRVVGEDQLSIAAPIRSRIPHFSCNDVVGFPDEIFQCQTLDGRGFQARDSQQHSGQRGQTFELHSGSLTHGRVVTWAPYGRES